MRFIPLFPVGRGGMGTVEVALDTAATPPRVCARKRLLADVAKDARQREAFLREARLAALLSHPNVVRTQWVGEEDGELVLAMDYVEGESLADVLSERGKLSPELAAYVMARVCLGLDAAHELSDVGGAPLNLVHRDVSPQNVMLGYDGRVLVLDFGVAKIDVGPGLTRTGEVKGKAAYMSPEQGMSDPIDRRSDLFSVGAVLYECVTGRRMWSGETEMAILKQLALEEPPRLEGPLGELCARLTARDPAARPETAGEVARALSELAGGVTQADLVAVVSGPRKHEKQARLARALAELEIAPPATRAPRRARWPILVVAGALGAVFPVWLLTRPEPQAAPPAPSAPAVTIAPAPEPLVLSAADAGSPRSEAPVVATPPLRAIALPRASAVPSSAKTPDAGRPNDVDPHPF